MSNNSIKGFEYSASNFDIFRFDKKKSVTQQKGFPYAVIYNPSTENIDVDDTGGSMNSGIISRARLNSFEVSDECCSENINFDYYSDLFEKYMKNYENSDIRSRTVAAALFLTTQLPKLPYFYGGGHEISFDEFVGLNPKWGKIDSIVYDSEDQNTGEKYPYSYDCSGFVTWAMINAGYKFNNFLECPTSSELRDMGETRELKGIDLSRVKAGDLAWMEGHIGLVVGVDVENKEVKIAHCSYSGAGMNITTMSTETGKIVDDSIGSTGTNREGLEYFTHITLFNYDK